MALCLVRALDRARHRRGQFGRAAPRGGGGLDRFQAAVNATGTPRLVAETCTERATSRLSHGARAGGPHQGRGAPACANMRFAAARLVGINHVTLEATDVDAALTFYGRLFQSSCAAGLLAWRSSTSGTSSSRSSRGEP